MRTPDETQRYLKRAKADLVDLAAAGLAAAIGNAAIKAGILNEEANLTGPHLVLLCENMADEIIRLRADVSVLRRVKGNKDFIAARNKALEQAAAVIDGAAEAAASNNDLRSYELLRGLSAAIRALQNNLRVIKP